MKKPKYSRKFLEKQAPTFQFAFKGEYDYSVQALESRNRRGDKEARARLRAEYTRMRDTAQKRLNRMKESRFSESSVVEERPEGFPKLKDLDPRDFPKAMNDLYRFLSAKTSTIYGQQKRMEKTIATFRRHGVRIKPEQYPTFIRVLEAMRKNKITYDSTHAKELTDFILSSNKITERSVFAKSRMKQIMDIVHDQDRKKRFLKEINQRQDNEGKGQYVAVSYDKTIKAFGW